MHLFANITLTLTTWPTWPLNHLTYNLLLISKNAHRILFNDIVEWMTSSVTPCFSVSELAFWKIIWLTTQLSWIFDCVCDNDRTLVQFWKTLSLERVLELFPQRTWWLSFYRGTTLASTLNVRLGAATRGMHFVTVRTPIFESVLERTKGVLTLRPLLKNFELRTTWAPLITVRLRLLRTEAYRS